MTAKRIDGKAISSEIKEEVKKQVAVLAEQNIAVTLAVVQVGEDPASGVYVRNKKKACEETGIRSLSRELPADISQEALLELIRELNERKDVNGILVQMPLPPHIDADAVVRAIAPQKDVDAFHPENVGALCIGQPGFLPCTPAGILELLKRSGISVSQKEAVVIGRSNIVGKPLALLLLGENATVTIAHSKTKDLKEVVRRADLVIAAVGKAEMITADYIKPGAVVIDVGMNRNAQNRLCGDVAFEEVSEKAAAITPVPGGVGPMTIAMLMKNCLQAAMRQNGMELPE